MKGKTKFKVMFWVLFILGTLVTLTVGVVYAQGAGEEAAPPEAAAPEIGDAPGAAELTDLQHVASQEGISLQAAIDRYGWNDNFALAVSRIREASPEAFARAEIVDGGHAWVGFAVSAPQAARGIIDTFTNSHSGVSVEVRTSLGFSEAELQRGIEAVHYAVFEALGVSDASTSFDFATGQIRTTVVLESTASESALDNLRAIAAANLTAATRADIVNRITTTVVRSDQQVLGGYDSSTEHLGGEALSQCTSGFGTTHSSGRRGISTAGHCDNPLTDDGAKLTFQRGHEGTHGDFQWHTGAQTETDDFYAGSSSSSETGRRDVSSVGSPNVGQLLYRNGKVSNRDYQKVRKINYCSGDLCNLVQMEGYKSAGGDSGGPVYWGNTAYGLHTGWVSDPSPTKREVFSRADRIDDALDVYIATTN